MKQALATKDRVRIQQVEVLSDNWYVLRKTTSTSRDGTGSGERCPGRPMTVVTVRRSCCTAR